MKYVERDKDGIVKGVYACLQPGYAEEMLPDDHPDILKFNDAQASIINQGKSIDARIRAIEEKMK